MRRCSSTYLATGASIEVAVAAADCIDCVMDWGIDCEGIEVAVAA